MYGDELAELDGAIDARATLAEARPRCEELHPLARRVFKNFSRLVRLRFAGLSGVTPAPPPQSARRRPAKALAVSEAWRRYRDLMARGKLRCGVTCPLDRIGQCTGGCW